MGSLSWRDKYSREELMERGRARRGLIIKYLNARVRKKTSKTDVKRMLESNGHVCSYGTVVKDLDKLGVVEVVEGRGHTRWKWLALPGIREGSIRSNVFGIDPDIIELAIMKRVANFVLEVFQDDDKVVILTEVHQAESLGFLLQEAGLEGVWPEVWYVSASLSNTVIIKTRSSIEAGKLCTRLGSE